MLVKTFAKVSVTTLSLALLLALGRQPAAAAVGYLSWSGPNPYSPACPATLNFTGHIDGAAGTSVTYFFARFVNSTSIDGPPINATIPPSGSLSITSALDIDSAHSGFQSYGLQITAPAGSDTQTHGKVYFTVNCSALQAIAPSVPSVRPVTLIPASASMAYFIDQTGFNPLCIPWPLPHPARPITDFGGAMAVGYTHHQFRGPNGDPCGTHSDTVYRIMLKAVVPPIHGTLSSIVLTATHVGTDTNTTCKLGVLTIVSGAFHDGNVGNASGLSAASGISWNSSSNTAVNYQIFPASGSFLAPAINAAEAGLFAGGGNLFLMLQGPNENIDHDNLRCLLKYNNFNLNVIAG